MPSPHTPVTLLHPPTLIFSIVVSALQGDTQRRRQYWVLPGKSVAQLVYLPLEKRLVATTTLD